MVTSSTLSRWRALMTRLSSVLPTVSQTWVGFDKIFIPARLSMLLPYLYCPLVVVYLCCICICICIVLHWIEIFICWEFYSPLSAELSMDTVAIHPIGHWADKTDYSLQIVLQIMISYSTLFNFKLIL